MLLYFEKIFESYVTGTASVYSNSELGGLLGSADLVTISGILSGIPQFSTTTFTCQFEQSFDGARWVNQNATPEVNAIALPPGGFWTVSSFTNNPTGGAARSALNRLRLALGAVSGPSPAAWVQLFASGRTA